MSFRIFCKKFSGRPWCGRLPAGFLILLLVVIFMLNTATVRRRKSAILRTQTDPIKLKDKMEEIKDGEKGPATPQFGWYGGGNGFMSKSPVGVQAPAEPAKTKEPEEPFGVTEVDEPKPAPKAPDALPQEENSRDEFADEDQDEQISGKADNAEDTAAPAGKGNVSEKEAAVAGSDKKDKDWWEEI